MEKKYDEQGNTWKIGKMNSDNIQKYERKVG